MPVFMAELPTRTWYRGPVYAFDSPRTMLYAATQGMVAAPYTSQGPSLLIPVPPPAEPPAPATVPPPLPPVGGAPPVPPPPAPPIPPPPAGVRVIEPMVTVSV